MSRSSRWRLLLTALCATACGDDNVVCVVPPCLAPVAVNVSITSATGGALNGPFVRPTASATALLCNPGVAATCIVTGGAGTYELDIGATGHQVVHRSVIVTSTTPKCGCENVATQQLNVTLPVAALR